MSRLKDRKTSMERSFKATATVAHSLQWHEAVILLRRIVFPRFQLADVDPLFDEELGLACLVKKRQVLISNEKRKSDWGDPPRSTARWFVAGIFGRVRNVHERANELLVGTCLFLVRRLRALVPTEV
jgi:hypothetical protein